MRRGAGRRRRLRWAVTLAIGIAGWSAACDSPPADPGRTICAQVGDGGAGCVSGSDAAAAPAPQPDAGIGGDPEPITATDVIMLPCTVCAHADACCKAQGLDDCGYTAACTGAHTNDEQQWRLAMCQAVVSGTPVAGRAHCAVGPR